MKTRISAIDRIYVWAAWILAAWLVGMSGLSLAVASPPQVSANTQMRTDALPKTEFDAIVAEASAVAGAPRTSAFIPLPTAWKALNREKLFAMLTMPGFGSIPPDPRGVLIDQAATWDMFTFTRPSDAAALWLRLWPYANHGPSDLRPRGDGATYDPNATWSPTSVAMFAIFNCFPTAVWNSQGDPLTFVVTHNLGWQWNGSQGWDAMGRCLPVAGFWEGDRPSAMVIEQAGKILVQKFTDELLQDGCTRSAADSCVVLFQALYGLDQKNPNLPAIIKRMETFYALDKPIQMPPAPTPPARRLKRDDVLPARTEILHRTFFLTMKLPVLLQHPEAWPAGELDKTVVQAMALALDLNRLAYMSRRLPNELGYFADPWQWITPAQQDQVTKAMAQAGVVYATEHGCEIGSDGVRAGTPDFWKAYVVENIRLSHGDCGRSYSLDLPQLVQAQGAERARLMQPLEPAAAVLLAQGEVRDHALDQVAEGCRAKKDTADDPLNLCAGIAARDADKLAQINAQAAEVAAHMPKVDPFVCDRSTIVTAAKELHFNYVPVKNSVCRKDPSNTSHAIVAFAYRTGEEMTGKEQENTDGDYNLDIVTIDLATNAILAHTHEPNAIPSDAVTFDSLAIDTGRYILAPGQRAFGIRVGHSSSCFQCAYGFTELTLYLSDGPQLNKVLSILADTSQNEPEDACVNAANPVSHSKTTVSIGKGTSHGLADIVLSTTTSVGGYGAGAELQECSPTSSTSTTVHFDGSRYPWTKKDPM